jgi:hypothetical protein
MRWSNEELTRAKALLDSGFSYAAAAEVLNEEFGTERSYHSVRGAARNGRVVLNNQDRDATVMHTVRNSELSHEDQQSETRHFSWQEWSSEIQNLQKLKSKAEWSQDVTAATIKSDKPIIVQFVGDLHFGASGADYATLEALTKRIKEVDNLYIILLGDVVDNFFNGFRSATAVFGQVMSPEEQLYFLESWLNDIKHKIIASTWGNHDAWYEYSKHGFNPIKVIQAKVCPYFDGIGRVKLNINDISYRICISHFFKGHSQWNPLHPMIRFSALQGGGEAGGIADIYAQGHIHEPALHQQYMHGKMTTYIRCGTLKVEDGYSNRYFSPYRLKVDFPSVLLHNDCKHVVPFLTGEDAITATINTDNL